MKDLIRKIRNYFYKKKSLKTCNNYCLCTCGNVLNVNASCTQLDIDGIYKYVCNDCNQISVFHFGIAPVPIKLDNYHQILE